MLGVKQDLSLLFDFFKHQLLQCPIDLHLDDFLEDVVSEWVGGEMLNNSFHSFVLLAWVSTQLTDKSDVVLCVIASQDATNLREAWLNLQALLNDIWRELQFAQSNEISSDKGEDLFVKFIVLNLQHVLDQVVAIRVFNQTCKSLNYYFSKSNFLGAETLLKASLHYAAALLVSSNLNRKGLASLEHEFCKLAVDLCTVDVRVLRKLRSSEKNEEILHHVVSITMCA